MYFVAIVVSNRRTALSS